MVRVSLFLWACMPNRTFQRKDKPVTKAYSEEINTHTQHTSTEKKKKDSEEPTKETDTTKQPTPKSPGADNGLWRKSSGPQHSRVILELCQDFPHQQMTLWARAPDHIFQHCPADNAVRCQIWQQGRGWGKAVGLPPLPGEDWELHSGKQALDLNSMAKKKLNTELYNKRGWW